MESPPPPILNPTRIPVQRTSKVVVVRLSNEPVLDKREFLQ